MKKLYLLLVMFFVSTLISAQLLQWNTFGNVGTETSEPSIYNDPNIGMSVWSHGPGVTPSANGNRFGGTSWFNTGNSSPNTLSESVTGNDYLQFVVMPNAGFAFTPTSLVFNWERSSTGPAALTLRSSLDGFTSNIGSVTGLPASLTVGNTITISGLTNVSTATTFRLYGYSATGTGGTGGFDQSINNVNIQLNGIATTLLGLPVTLTSFSAQKYGGRNQLRWTTATETNNQGFEIQRSTDGTNYTVIGFVNSQAAGGNSSDQLQYSFTDQSPIGARQYYRLRQVDLNRSARMSQVVLIRGEKPLIAIIDGVFPNPVSHQLNIMISSPVQSQVNLEIRDISGKRVISFPTEIGIGSNTLQVNLSSLAKGLYQLSINGSNGIQSMKYFIKQ